MTIYDVLLRGCLERIVSNFVWYYL